MSFRIIAVALLLVLASSVALAEGWRPMLTSHTFGPERILAVDKGSQTFFVLTRESPMEVTAEFPCTTGQVEGDKQIQGDLRTPEGVYFITSRINRTLDFEMYGDAAYALNYPNPVDRLEGKTGSGIWIHGRGRELTARDTRGCVALANPDILTLDDRLEPGIPVVIGQGVAWTREPGENEALAQELVEQVRGWAHAWASRDGAFFDYYDQDRFARTSGSPFLAFVRHKQSIFDSNPWIDVMVTDVRVLPGPNYWVTWFDQYYRTPGMTSAVGKRFYWQQGDDGRWRIVGREYVDASPGLEDRYLASRSEQALAVVSAWRDAWLAADADQYAEFYAENAVQGRRSGRADIAGYKAGLWAERAPVRVDVENMDVTLHPQGLAVRFVQHYEDSTGYADQGDKLLVLAPSNQGWHIVSESWTRIR